MKKIIIIDFRKREERRSLQGLPRTYVSKMDTWIKSHGEYDKTPPNEEECAALEAGRIEQLLGEFDAAAGDLWRVKDEVPDQRAILKGRLERRKGKLFAKFSDEVEALGDLAAKCMRYCVECLEQTAAVVEKSIPCKPSAIDGEFNELKETCNAYIALNFPGGVERFDSYDKDMPQGVPSGAEFIKRGTAKKDELMKANADAIPKEIETVRAAAMGMIKKEINDAIKQAMKDIETDLSEDTLPYMDEDAMASLRQELIAMIKEYGQSRLDEEE